MLIKFNEKEYSKEVRKKKFKGVKVHTFFVYDGFDLDPFPPQNKPWFDTGKTKNGFKVYQLKDTIDFILPNWEVVRVPKGFEWDGASIPKFAQWIIGKPIGKYALAALLHDWLYRSQLLGKTKKGRKKSDELFLLVMDQLDVTWWRRKSMYSSVRIGGGSAYFDSSEVEKFYILMKDDFYNPF